MKLNNQRKIFVNLPVKDLKRAVNFFTELGFTFNSNFNDENATCMIVAPGIFIMLLTEPFFQTFIEKDICDSSKASETIICLSAESRNEIDELVNIALKNGGSSYAEKQNNEWMYKNGFEDPDGHLWELVYMEKSEKVRK